MSSLFAYHTEYLPGQLHCSTQVTASVFTYSNM